jgi:hypothetical protein
VGGGDRADDREAEAVAATVAGACGPQPLEGLLEALELGSTAGKYLVCHHRQVDRLTPVECPLAAREAEQRLDQALQLLLGGEHPLVGRSRRHHGRRMVCRVWMLGVGLIG